MLSFRVLLAAFILAAPAQSFSQQIVATFEGTFTSRNSQQNGGQLIATTVDIPFTSTISIFTDAPQFYEYLGQNTTQTLFGGPSFSTSITDTVRQAHALSSVPSINYSHSVYWFGYEPAGDRNDLVSFATSNFYDQIQNEQWIYQLVIRSGINVPADQERGPVTGHTLLEGLTFAMNAGQSYQVTEFYEVYSLTGGGRTDADWYTGSARLSAVSSVSPVPEPSTYALMLAGVAAISLAARRRRATVGG